MELVPHGDITFNANPIKRKERAPYERPFVSFLLPLNEGERTFYYWPTFRSNLTLGDIYCSLI